MESQKSLKEDWLLWVLLVAALGLTAGYYFLSFSSESQEQSPEWLFEGVKANSIRGLKKYRGDTLVYSLTRETNNDWTLSTPEEVTLDQSAVEDWLKTILSPEINRRFKQNPGADYGFTSDPERLQIVQQKKRHTLHFGRTTPTGQGFYLRYGDGDGAPVFVLPDRKRAELLPDLYDIRNKDLFDQKSEDVTALSLDTEEDSVTYRRTGDRWMISSGRNSTLNETASRDLDESLSTLLTAQGSSYYDAGAPDTYTPTRGRLTLRFAEGTRTVSLGGKARNERLIRVGKNPVVGVTRDPVSIFRSLPAKPEGWPTVDEPTSTKPPSGNQPSSEKLRQLRKKLKQSPSRQKRQ